MSNESVQGLKQKIVDSLDIKGFYESCLSKTGKPVSLDFKSDGWSNPVHCPIHDDTGKPNLSINRISGGFRCFAVCGGGSIFDFWCFTNGKDPKVGFAEALVALANLAGVDIKTYSSKDEVPAKPVDSIKTPKPKNYVPKVNKAAAIDSTTIPMDNELVIGYTKNLKENHYKYLLYKRGLVEQTIKRYAIGWNPDLKYTDIDGKKKKGRFTFPVLCKEGLVRNIRVYAPDAHKEKDAKIKNTFGHGSPIRLFGLHELLKYDWDHVCIVEGEWDAMLLNQHFAEHGLNGKSGWGAVSGTGGANTFEAEWLEYFFGKHTYFIFDADATGKLWATNHCTKHFLPALTSKKVPDVRIVNLPLDGTKDAKDITDYFVKLNSKFEDFFEIVQSTPVILHGGVNNDDATVQPIDIDNFITCIKDRKFIDQRVKVPLTISGQSTKIYHAPRTIRVDKCPLMTNGECCASNTGLQILPYGDPIFIAACMSTEKQTQAMLQSVACTKGKPCHVEEVDKVVMEEYFGHQVIKRLTAKEDKDGRLINSQELVTTSVYVLQPEKNIDIGPHDYIATGFVRSHPHTRQATLFVENLEPMEEDWKAFKVDESSKKKLNTIKNFSVKEILDDISTHVTHIYKADEIHLAVLLTYLSPLWINFNGKALRGWINSCILGDSGTGKSATYMRISDWLELGDLFSSLSGTRTGLLYSIKQKGVEWYVQIGRYVMASGKIIAVDEVQETPAEEIKKMAKAMDEGWLEVSQVASGGYRTQTRTVFLMNPKNGKKISDFAYGCQAIVDCFDPMFIRRLDIAIFSSGKEDYDFYNKAHAEKNGTPQSVTSEIFRTLIYWAWTRTINDIHWSEEATKQCLKQATELSNIYGQADDIPLVNPQDFRNNIARLSTALAILSGSFTEDFEGVNVTENHVEKICQFINVVYSSSSCNLRQHSKNSGKKKSLKDFETIEETFSKIIEHSKHSRDRRFSEGQHFLQLILLMQQQQFARRIDLVQQLGISLAWLNKHLAILQMYNLVESYRSGIRITRKFNLFLQRWQENPEVESMLEAVYEKIGKLAMTTDVTELTSQEVNYASHEPDNPF